MIAWRNRLAATATALAFAIGTIVVPGLHLAFHAHPHDHHGGEIRYHLALGEHYEHDHHDHHDHAGERHEDEHHHGDRDHEPFDPHHGDGSAAHFSSALGDAPASAIDLALVGFAEHGRIAPRRHLFHTPAHVSVLRFRGPPVAS